MATFSTRTQEIAGVSGDQGQQIASAPVVGFGGFADAIKQGTETALSIGGALAERRGEKLAEEAASQIDKAVGFAEQEIEAGVPSLRVPEGVKLSQDKMAVLTNAVRNGTMSQEKARLFAADIVKQEVANSPLFSQMIRRGAAGILGFDPQSEAVRQTIGAFPTSSELASRRKEGINQTVANLVNLGLDEPTARKVVAQNTLLKLQKDNALLALELGTANAETTFSKLEDIDRVEVSQKIFRRALEAKQLGQEVNEDFFRNELNKNKDAYKQALFSGITANGGVVDSATRARFESAINTRYEDVLESIKGFDTAFLTSQNLKRLQTFNEAFGAETLPVFKFFNDAFGERVAGTLTDFVISAGGNPERLRALASSNPTLAPLVGLLQTKPEEFTKRVLGSARRLASKDGSFTNEDAQVLDLTVSQTKEQLDPEGASVVAQLLAESGRPNKAASVMAEIGRAGATPEIVQFMKNEFKAIDNSVRSLAELMADREGAEIVYNPTQGKFSLRGLNRQGDLVTQEVGPAADLLNKFNNVIKASRNGWSTDFGISDSNNYARRLINRVTDETTKITNERLEEERKSAERRRAEFERARVERSRVSPTGLPLTTESERRFIGPDTVVRAQQTEATLTDERRSQLQEEARRRLNK